MGLEEHGLVESLDGCGDGGVEALEVTDGDDATAGTGDVENVIGFSESGGEGLLDEDVEVGEKELLGDGGVVDGGDADGCGVEGEVGGEEIGDGREGGDVAGGGEGGASIGVGFDEGGEMNEVGVSELELAVDAEMIAPEGTGADDGYVERGHDYFLADDGAGTGASTAARQRA